MSPLQRGQFWPYTQNTFYFLNIILIFFNLNCPLYVLYVDLLVFSLPMTRQMCVHCLLTILLLFPEIIPDTDGGIQYFVK